MGYKLKPIYDSVDDVLEKIGVTPEEREKYKHLIDKARKFQSEQEGISRRCEKAHKEYVESLDRFAEGVGRVVEAVEELEGSTSRLEQVASELKGRTSEDDDPEMPPDGYLN